jgi:hypothetical protein
MISKSVKRLFSDLQRWGKLTFRRVSSLKAGTTTVICSRPAALMLQF